MHLSKPLINGNLYPVEYGIVLLPGKPTISVLNFAGEILLDPRWLVAENPQKLGCNPWLMAMKHHETTIR